MKDYVIYTLSRYEDLSSLLYYISTNIYEYKALFNLLSLSGVFQLSNLKCLGIYKKKYYLRTYLTSL